MAIVRWDPWRELSSMERQLDELVGRVSRSTPRGGSTTWAPMLDAHQEGDTMVVCVEVPGVSPDQVELTVEDDVLTISGQREEDKEVRDDQWIRRERFRGTFRRSISLPPGIPPDQIKATAENGLLEIRIPRPQNTSPHRVAVQSGANAGRGGKSSATEIPVTSEDDAASAGNERSSASAAKDGGGKRSKPSTTASKRRSSS
jgi:HSP20 family protein